MRDALAKAKQARQEAEGRAEAAVKERDAGGPRPQGRPQGAPEATAPPWPPREKARDEAEARAEARRRERDALAMEMDAATQVNRDENAAGRAHAPKRSTPNTSG